jgi:site-specific DNA-methyltransferase (adenine-specific)
VVAERKHPQPFYEGTNGSLFLGDAIHWLKEIESGAADLLFADPPYNINKAEWDTFDSIHAYVAWSREWLTEASRVLKPTGTAYVCVFSEILADVKVAGIGENAPAFNSKAGGIAAETGACLDQPR